MHHILDPLAAQESSRFFAADAAGAEHRDPLARKLGGVVAPPAGEIAETLRLRIDRADKAAVTDLQAVARVDQHRVRIVDQRVPVGGVALADRKSGGWGKSG